MWQFWVRFIIFIGLWSLITLTQQTENGFSISLILLALSLICFFFFSIKILSLFFLLCCGFIACYCGDCKLCYFGFFSLFLLGYGLLIHLLHSRGMVFPLASY